MKTIHYWSLPGIKKKGRELFVWEVVKEVAAWDGVEAEQVRRGREDRFVHMRYVVIYLMAKFGKMRQRELARYFGYRDRMSVAKGKRWVEDRMAWNGEMRDMVEWVEMRLLGWDRKDLDFKSRRGE